jgi:hypothetical protein
MSPRPSRAAAAAAEKKIKRDIEEILLPSDVKENYHRADLAVRMATKNGNELPSSHRNTTASTTLKSDDANETTQQEPRNHKKAKTATSTTIPNKSDKTPPPPRPLFNNSTKNFMDVNNLANAVENGPILGRATVLHVSKTIDYSCDEMAVMLSPLCPKAITFSKRVHRRHG